MAATQKIPKALPPVEWDFFGLDDREVLLAFYYEYGRSSDFVKSEVGKMRALRPHPRIWPYPAIMDKHRLHNELFWLAEQETHFPETPWLTIKANAIAEIKRQRVEARSKEAQINATLPPGTKFCGGGRAGKPDDPVKTIEWMVEAKFNTLNIRLGAGNFSHFWMGDEQKIRIWEKRRASTHVTPAEWTINVQPEHGIISGGVDWRATDEEIMEQFRWFLERERPNQFKENAKTPLVQRGFDIVFPFRKRSALDWLSVLRRRKQVKNWNEFFDLYPDARRRSVQKKHSDWFSEQARSKEVRFANQILDWFNTGAPMKKKDFR
jgi:hypothetical protein